MLESLVKISLYYLILMAVLGKLRDYMLKRNGYEFFTFLF